MIVLWITLAYLAVLVFAACVGAGLRSARESQTRPVPRVEQVRDQQLDIEPALKREVGR